MVKYKQDMLHTNTYAQLKSLNYHLHAHPLSQVQILSFIKHPIQKDFNVQYGTILDISNIKQCNFYFQSKA